MDTFLDGYLFWAITFFGRLPFHRYLPPQPPPPFSYLIAYDAATAAAPDEGDNGAGHARRTHEWGALLHILHHHKR